MATMPCCKIMPFLMRFRTLSWIRFEVQTFDIFVCNLHGQKRQKTTVPGDDFSGCAITGFISLLNYVHVCGLVFNGVVRMQWPTRCVCWQWPECQSETRNIASIFHCVTFKLKIYWKIGGMQFFFGGMKKKSNARVQRVWFAALKRTHFCN